MNKLKYLSWATIETVCYLSGTLSPPAEGRRAVTPARPHSFISAERGSENCPFFNGCFELKRIIISLEVLKFPRRNPTVLLVLRLLSFYTFDRLPGASITAKLMADGEKVKGKLG